MLIQNVLYSTIDLYIKKINQYLDDGYFVSSDCKTYDKNKDDIVIFKCFNIKSQVKTNNELIISEIEYSGYLEFTYNKATNEVYISKLPYVFDGKVEIPIFTSDIAQIIVDKVKSYIPSDDIKLTFFSPVMVFAIDNKIQEIIPSIIDTKNFNIINSIIERIDLEERRIRQHVLSLKAQKDREDRAIERAVSRKRRIYGIDPNDYENQQEFYRIVDKKICEVYSRKIEKITRHLHLNENKYKEMLNNEILLAMLTSYNGFISSNQSFSNWALENEIDIDKFEYVFYQGNSWLRPAYFGEEIDIEQTKEEWEQVKARYIEYLYQHDLYDSRGILALVDYVKREIMPLPELREPGEPRINNDTLYTWVITQLAAIAGNGDTNGWVNGEYDYTDDRPIFGNHNYSYTKTRPSQWWNDGWIYTYKFSRDIGKAIELLLQIRSLTKQLEYYRSILNEPSKALLSFKKDNDSWASIMQYPYFVRMGRDHHLNGGHELFNLLMIKPETLIFDEKNIRYFVQKGDREKNVRPNCDRMVVAIPDSLQQYYLLMVIQYAHDRGKHLNFICQSPDLASRVKSILVNMELSAKKNNSSYIKGKYFINVDPNYYDSFFVNTPDNKEFWHRYDYSSDYKYRRKIIYDLETIIDMCIHEYLQKNTSSKEVNDDILSEMILGSYSGDNVMFDLDGFLLDKQGVDGRTLPDDSDRILAFMQKYSNEWKKELPLIDNYKDGINHYLESSYEEFLRKKEEMLVFKELFPDNWQEMWTKLYLSTPAGTSLLDTADIKNRQAEILIFQDLFPDDWKRKLTEIKKERDFYNALIALYKIKPRETKENVLTRKKSRNWKSQMKSWVFGALDDEYDGFLPF